MKDKVTVAVDGMGGDHGPAVVVEAVAMAVKQLTELHIALVGNKDILQGLMRERGIASHPRVTVRHASEAVAMDESPTVALRSKKDSSMRVALTLVKEGAADACVSGGNTGALMAIARFVLKTIPGIDRPAIISSLPTLDINKSVQLLDLGANVDSSPEHLCQFAVMGSVYAAAVMHVEKPTVALLNVGSEDIKGNEVVKATAARLAEYKDVINYVGFVEGDDIYKGVIDVVVCDGFVGNIAIKASEGLSRLITTHLKQGFNGSCLGRVSGLLAKPVLRRVGKRVDPARYNGASLLGLQGIVLKSHGSAKSQAFVNAISRAYAHGKQDIPSLISHKIERLLQDEVSD